MSFYAVLQIKGANRLEVVGNVTSKRPKLNGTRNCVLVSTEEEKNLPKWPWEYCAFQMPKSKKELKKNGFIILEDRINHWKE